MYKLLVTTRCHDSKACAVHTIVVEFENRTGALDAYKIINDSVANKDSYEYMSVTQNCIKLFS